MPRVEPAKQRKVKEPDEPLDRSRFVYDSRKPLRCCEFTQLRRCLGVLVTKPFMHHGLGVEMAEVDAETISVNSRTFGQPQLVDEAVAVAGRMTETIIKDIDVVVAELLEHRQRLLVELEDVIGPCLVSANGEEGME